MPYSSQQLNLARDIIAVGKALGASRKQIKSALETGLVESNLSNPTGGMGTSAGWRQEINTYGSVGKRTNVQGAARRYFNEAAGLDRAGLSSGALAAAVQRPAAGNRGKYGLVSGEAGKLLRQLSGAGGGSGISPAGGIGGSASRVIPGKTTTNIDAAILDALMTGQPNPATRAGELVASGRYTSTSDPRTVQANQDPGGTPAKYGDGRAKIGPNADRPGVRTKPKVLNFVKQIAGILGEDLTITTGSNHHRMTVNGNVSQHWTGDAADIPGTGRRLIRMGQAALIAAGMSPQQAHKKTGGLFNVGGRQIIFNCAGSACGGDHTDHLHVGL